MVLKEISWKLIVMTLNPWPNLLGQPDGMGSWSRDRIAIEKPETFDRSLGLLVSPFTTVLSLNP